MPATKDQVLKAIEELPSDATLEDAMERLYFLHKVEKGVRDADAGETLSVEEVRQRITNKWR